MLLKNGDRKVLRFDLDDFYMEVLDNAYLPYALKDFVQTSDFSSMEKMKRSARDMDVLKDYLCTRTLTLDRENAKTILNVASLPQSLKTNERLKIVLACQGLSMTDNFWLCEESDTRRFSEVNLRNHKLGDAAYEVSILGRHISVSHDILAPDISTDGMFAKTWVRKEDGVELWKTDKTVNSINTCCEKKASELLDYTNISHVKYDLFERDGRKIVSCACLATDSISLINGYDLRDWCTHTGKDFTLYMKEHFLENFSKMCVADYLLANTDRHLGNILFMVDNATNEILDMAPLMDHNQALISDLFDKDVSDLVYDATGLTIRESAEKYFASACVKADIEKFPKKCQERFYLLEEKERQLMPKTADRTPEEWER